MASSHHALFQPFTTEQAVPKDLWARCKHCATPKWQGQRKYSVGMRPGKYVCVRTRARLLATRFNLPHIKQDCWLLVYSTKCLPANFIFFHPSLNYFPSRSKPTLAPGANTSRTKHCLSIEECSVGIISIFARGQTEINDWYFALACRHELWVMTFSVSEISLYAPQRIEGHIWGITHFKECFLAQRESTAP